MSVTASRNAPEGMSEGVSFAPSPAVLRAPGCAGQRRVVHLCVVALPLHALPSQTPLPLAGRALLIRDPTRETKENWRSEGSPCSLMAPTVLEAGVIRGQGRPRQAISVWAVRGAASGGVNCAISSHEQSFLTKIKNSLWPGCSREPLHPDPDNRGDDPPPPALYVILRPPAATPPPAVAAQPGATEGGGL